MSDATDIFQMLNKEFVQKRWLIFSHQGSAKGSTKKRERAANEAEGSTPKPSKKVMKSAEKTEAPPPETFKPFDYSQSDLKVFAGMLDRSPMGQAGQSEHFWCHSLRIRMSEFWWVFLLLFYSGTKSKDNTQFDPNRQDRDFKKKVCSKFLSIIDLFLNKLTDLTFPFNRNNQRARNPTLGQGPEVCLTWLENQKGKMTEWFGEKKKTALRVKTTIC